MKLFKKKPKETKFPDTKNPIELAFTVDGIDYFQFKDPFNIPYKRGLTSVTFFEEVRMKCTFEYLKKHQEAINKILTSSNIDIFSIKKINDQLGERLNFVYTDDTIYKLASVVFFDATENPADYDFVYSKEKIDKWKKSMPAHDFFLQQPIATLLPFLKDPNLNIQSYSKAANLINQIHLGNLQEVLLQN